MNPIDVAYAALLDAGRSDLAHEIIGFEDEGGFYLEVPYVILGEDDWRLVDRAEGLARQSAGLSPIERGGRLDVEEDPQ